MHTLQSCKLVQLGVEPRIVSDAWMREPWVLTLRRDAERVKKRLAK